MQLKRILIAALIAASLTQGAHAGSVAGFGGSTEVTQILNNVELVNQGAQMYQVLQQTIEQVKYTKQQLDNLIKAPQMFWGEAAADLQQLAQLVAKGQALGYALGNIDQQFANKYQGYNPNTYQTASRNWTDTSMDSLKAALQTAGLQSNQFTSEQATISSIQNLAATAPGALQATQAGVMVASQQVVQLQKLRQLYMAQMQAQNAYMAQQVQEQQDSRDQAIHHFQKYTPSGTPGFSSAGGKK